MTNAKVVSNLKQYSSKRLRQGFKSVRMAHGVDGKNSTNGSIEKSIS